jgi:rhamnosyltransferase
LTYSIAAIVVTYNPDPIRLERLLSSLIGFIPNVLVVDNGSSGVLTSRLLAYGSSVELLELRENKGIAYAQNQGINWAMQRGVGDLIFFDQDSIPAPDMVEILHAQLHTLQASGKRIACIGPRFIDSRSATSIHPSITSGILPVDTLISSGSMTSVEVIKAVGRMTDELFIDYVDLDWCLRARSMGYMSYQSQEAVMYHSLGDDPIPFFGKHWPSRSPLRHYYMCRNAIWMYKNSPASFRWKFIDFLKLLRKIVFYSLFAKPRLDHIKMMFLGLMHGLVGKMGRFSP